MNDIHFRQATSDVWNGDNTAGDKVEFGTSVYFHTCPLYKMCSVMLFSVAFISPERGEGSQYTPLTEYEF